MGRLGITNVLPLTGGQGITVIGNKINLGGSITNDIEIDIGDNELLLFQTSLFFNRIKATGVKIVDAATELIASVGVNNSGVVALWASDNIAKETTITNEIIQLNNGNNGKGIIIGNVLGTDEYGIVNDNAAIDATIISVSGDGLSAEIKNGAFSTNGNSLTIDSGATGIVSIANDSINATISGQPIQIPITV